MTTTQEALISERKHIHSLNKIAMQLTAKLCQLHTYTMRDGDECLRREDVMQLVTEWRAKWDVINKDQS